MKQQNNQIDQKKGSADRDVTGSKKGMPGGEIGRNSMGSGQASSAGYGGYENAYGSSASTGSASSGARSTANNSNSAPGKPDYGGTEGNSRERKSARNGSDSNES